MNRSFVLFAVLFSSVFFFGFDWPMDQNTIIMNFCESTGEDYRTGLVVSGTEKPVHPIAEGDLVFYREEGEANSGVPFGLGSFACVLHEGGIQSVYSHLKKGSIKTDSVKLSKTDVIGITGNTGSSLGDNMVLQIFNIEDAEILNPVKILTPLQKDTHAPVIRDVLIKRNDEMISASTIKLIAAGNYEIFVSTYDPGDDVTRHVELVPYKVSVSNNGNEISNITFQSLKEKDGVLILYKSEKTFRDIYSSPSVYRLGTTELVEGKNHIQVIASDFVGNQAVKDIILDVTR